jgi:putative SOS response-associated peptidase YedK
MCGRSSLTKTEKEIEARFNATFYSEELERYNPLPNYNVAPTNMMPSIIMEEPSIIHLYRWGLVPSWAKDTKIGHTMINARLESLQEKPAFKRLISRQRCILPLDGFYEWKSDGKSKIPYRIQTVDQDIFSVAGLYDQWKDPSNGQMLHSFTIITLAANAFMAQIHDRMPAILNKQMEIQWLDADLSPTAALEALQAYPSDAMTMYRVSDKVNNVRERGAELIELVDDKPLGPQQLSLF